MNLRPFNALYATVALGLLSLAGPAVGDTTELAEATTTPCGYIVYEFPQGAATPLGMGIHGHTVVAGKGEISNGNLVDNEVNFTETLESKAAYILEIESGSHAGATCLINRNGWRLSQDDWDGSTLNLSFPSELSSPSGTVSYKLRKAPTIADIFGAANEKSELISSTNYRNADQLTVPDGQGGDATYFYNGKIWRAKTGVNETKDVPLYYAEPLYVNRVEHNAAKMAIIVGEVLETSKMLSLLYKEITVNAGFAIPQTLTASGLNDNQDWISSNTFTRASKISVPRDNDGLVEYYSRADKQWRQKNKVTSQDDAEFEGAVNISSPSDFTPYYLRIINPFETLSQTN